MQLWVGSQNPVKIGAAQYAINTLADCQSLQATGVSAPSGVPDQPMNEAQTRLGAVNRVNYLRSLPQVADDDWCVAIEGGVDNFVDGPATFAYVAISRGDQLAVGRSANLPLPEQFYRDLEQGDELGNVMDKAFNTDNIKQKGGAIGLLTDHNATRQSVYEVALVLALARFRYAELY